MITQERLRQVAAYDEHTGEFIRIKPLKGRRVGQAMGSKRWDGYVRIRIDQRTYYGHRLAWFWAHNEWPPEEIDHIDGNPSNNRLSNLRAVSRAVNQENIRKPPRHNTTKLLGASRAAGGKFMAALMVRKRQVYLGTFSTAEEAHAAYLTAKRRLHAGCTI